MFESEQTLCLKATNTLFEAGKLKYLMTDLDKYIAALLDNHFATTHDVNTALAHMLNAAAL